MAPILAQGEDGFAKMVSFTNFTSTIILLKNDCTATHHSIVYNKAVSQQIEAFGDWYKFFSLICLYNRNNRDGRGKEIIRLDFNHPMILFIYSERHEFPTRIARTASQNIQDSLFLHHLKAYIHRTKLLGVYFSAFFCWPRMSTMD